MSDQKNVWYSYLEAQREVLNLKHLEGCVEIPGPQNESKFQKDHVYQFTKSGFLSKKEPVYWFSFLQSQGAKPSRAEARKLYCSCKRCMETKSSLRKKLSKSTIYEHKKKYGVVKCASSSLESIVKTHSTHTQGPILIQRSAASSSSPSLQSVANRLSKSGSSINIPETASSSMEPPAKRRKLGLSNSPGSESTLHDSDIDIPKVPISNPTDNEDEDN
jgi:hypothetical protein